MSKQTKANQNAVKSAEAMAQLHSEELKAIAGGTLPVRRDVINWQTNGVE